MKRTLFAVFTLVVLAGCYRSQLNSPGLSAKGLSSQPPSPAYGQLTNQSKSLDYDYALANKTLDYQMVEFQTLVDYELKMKKAWESCLADHPAKQCAMIHGGWPYYMSYMGMGYGYGGYGGMSGYYPGCPYQDGGYCQTWFETQAYMQAQAQLGSASNLMAPQASLGQEHAKAAAQVWSSQGSEDYQKMKEELEGIRDEILVNMEKMQEMAAEQDEELEEIKPILDKVLAEPSDSE